MHHCNPGRIDNADKSAVELQGFKHATSEHQFFPRHFESPYMSRLSVLAMWCSGNAPVIHSGGSRFESQSHFLTRWFSSLSSISSRTNKENGKKMEATFPLTCQQPFTAPQRILGNRKGCCYV